MLPRRLADISNSGGWRESQPPMPKKESIFIQLKNFLLERFPSGWKGWLVLLAILFLAWKLAISLGWLPSLTFPAVDRNKWQAVFLANGQVYFGRLREVNREYVLLKDTYYLRVNQQLQPSQQQQQQINLVKLGNEIHGPEDTMYIPKSQINFWENMRDDSSVTQLIKQLMGPNQPK
ncbi:MAG: hypothetical protein HYY86_03880 [Candidatus Harrisonbacteria bacterium]|nr:hypothetical protein [Candidatus Harrisonbacteria bacterium]